MTILLELKEKMKILYARYSFWIHPLLKFLLAMIVFTTINGMLGYMELLNNIFVLLITSLLCAIMPLNTIVVFGGLMITAHTFALGLEVGGITLVLILVMYLLFFRFAPKEGLAFILTPAAFSFGMPAVVPLGAGLLGGASSAVSVCMGTVLHYYLQVIRNVVEPMKEAAEQDLLANIQALLGGVLDQKQMFVMMAAGVMTALVVSFIRRLSVNYAWYLAIAAGSLSYVIVATGGSIALGADFPAGIVLVGTFGSALAALILEFFFFHVDYRKTEYLQYQDDTYVYYVKAVPKEAAKIRQERRGEERKEAAKAAIHPDSQTADRQTANGLESDGRRRAEKSPGQRRIYAQPPDQQREIPKMREEEGDFRTGEPYTNPRTEEHHVAPKLEEQYKSSKSGGDRERPAIEKQHQNPEPEKRQRDFRLEEELYKAKASGRAEHTPLNNPYQQNDSARTASEIPDIDFEAKLEETLKELRRNIK